MPKATTKSSTARTHESSPKKPSRANVQTGTADAAHQVSSSTSPSDPSGWRVSKLSDSETITKSNATKLYRLKDRDFEGIPFRTEQTVARGSFITSMHIYKERDIERRAWERHGGPEGFDKYLAKLRASYLKKNGAYACFPQPSTYDDLRGGVYVVSIKPGLPHDSDSEDPYVGRSPTLLNIKKQMAPWLWMSYNKALSKIDDLNWESVGMSGRGLFTRDRDREGPMNRALAIASTYPPRPTEPLPSSTSVDKVREVLREAASPPGGRDWGRDDIPGLDFVMSQPEDVEEYEWSKDYLERLFSAMIEVTNEHGLGPEGLEGIRWEVYDKHIACMHVGPYYDRKDDFWRDEAAQWLDGHFANFGIQLVHNPRGFSSVGFQP